MKWFDNIKPVLDVSCNRAWVIGDVHGCFDQLEDLLDRIPYDRQGDAIVLLGDIADRGPKPTVSLDFVRRMCTYGFANIPTYCVMGNHDAKLLRAFNGAKVTFNNGLQDTWDELHNAMYVAEVELPLFHKFLQQLPLTIRVHTHDGDAVVVHAAYDEFMIGHRDVWSLPRSVEWAIFGPTDGKLADGFPNRIAWEEVYDGHPHVFYGHKIVGDVPKFVNKTIGVDTGCYESGILTAVSFPDLQTISISKG